MTEKIRFNLESADEMPEKEVIVEVGPSMVPAYVISREIRDKIERGASYIAIDYDDKKLETVKREEISKAIAGDLGNLPIKNESVDEMWLLNVFGGLKERKYPPRDRMGN